MERHLEKKTGKREDTQISGDVPGFRQLTRPVRQKKKDDRMLEQGQKPHGRRLALEG
jgi:hypothetical protein